MKNILPWIITILMVPIFIIGLVVFILLYYPIYWISERESNHTLYITVNKIRKKYGSFDSMDELVYHLDYLVESGLQFDDYEIITKYKER